MFTLVRLRSTQFFSEKKVNRSIEHGTYINVNCDSGLWCTNIVGIIKLNALEEIYGLGGIIGAYIYIMLC